MLLQDAAVLSYHWLLSHDLFRTREFTDFKQAVETHCSAVTRVQLAPTLSTADRRTLEQIDEIAAMGRESAVRSNEITKAAADAVAKQSVFLGELDGHLKVQRAETDDALNRLCDVHEELYTLKLAHLPPGLEADQARNAQSLWRDYKVKLAELKIQRLRCECLGRCGLVLSILTQPLTPGVESVRVEVATPPLPQHSFSTANATASSGNGVASSVADVASRAKKPVVEASSSRLASPASSSASIASSSSTAPSTPVQASSPSSSSAMPPFKMAQSTTISALARDWWVPHGPHNTCVEEMERKWGLAWRSTTNPDGSKNDSVTKYYNGRVALMEEIHRRALLLAQAKGRAATTVDEELAAAATFEQELQELPSGQRTVYHQMQIYRKAKRQKTAHSPLPSVA